MSRTFSWNVSFAATHHDVSSVSSKTRVDESALIYRRCCSISLFIIAAALLASYLQAHALQCHQLFFLLRMLLRRYFCCHLCYCASCFYLRSLVLRFQQGCFSASAAAAVFFCIDSCVMCFFFFFGGDFFYCDDNFLISFFEFQTFHCCFL